MDRLETPFLLGQGLARSGFTFQYGQIRNKQPDLIALVIRGIYIPVWIDQKRDKLTHIAVVTIIYIPVWIDQKLNYKSKPSTNVLNLHSSMDRLETLFCCLIGLFIFEFTFQYGQIRNCLQKTATYRHYIIYIPVWIDQKPLVPSYYVVYCKDLHSSMDRLETESSGTSAQGNLAFTFQYGQIRNSSTTKRTI